MSSIGAAEAPSHRLILDEAVEVIGCQAGTLQIVDEERDGLRLAAARGLHHATVRAWEFLPAGPSSVCGQTLAGGERTVVEDSEAEAAFAGSMVRNEWRRSGIRAIQSTPLVADGRIVGMLSTYWPAPHSFTRSELRLIDRVARNAATRLPPPESNHSQRQLAARLLREVNHRIREMAETFDALAADDQPQEYLCECGCGSRVALTAGEFDTRIATEQPITATGHLPKRG